MYSNIMYNNFVKQVLDNNGSITPLIVPAEYTNGTGIFNPSVNVINNNLFVNIRHCQVSLYQSETTITNHVWGPLVYLHPENDVTLTTTNYLCSLNKDFSVNKAWKVDMSLFDKKPLWTFRGLEDARLLQWNGKIYLCGCRRDTTTNGVSRMELSEIIFENNTWKEISRERIPTPVDPNSYCEKNWMPVLDKPYHWVKWTNPTEVVRWNPKTKFTEQVVLHNKFDCSTKKDMRGNSHIFEFENEYIALTHTVDLWKNELDQKNACYRHCVVGWDKNSFEPKWYIPEFDFMGMRIEFVCGAVPYKNDILITFGVQDNAAYILQVPKTFFSKWLNNAKRKIN